MVWYLLPHWESCAFCDDGVQRLKPTDSLWNGQDIIFVRRKKLTSAVLVSFSWSMNTLWAHITKSPGSAWSATSWQENASKPLLCSPKQLNHFLNAALGLRNVAGLVSIPGKQKWLLSVLSCGRSQPMEGAGPYSTGPVTPEGQWVQSALWCFAGTQELVWQKQNHIWMSFTCNLFCGK